MAGTGEVRNKSWEHWGPSGAGVPVAWPLRWIGDPRGPGAVAQDLPILPWKTPFHTSARRSDARFPWECQLSAPGQSLRCTFL